jgi:predicted nucleic acid-binding protein
LSTAVDANIFLDIALPDAAFAGQSIAALRLAVEDGAVFIAEPVYAEIAGLFDGIESLDEFLQAFGVYLRPSSQDVLHAAGLAWRRYGQRRPVGLACPACGAVANSNCERCGQAIQVRQHLMSDFLIGAHADAYAGRLLTRDRGYYRTYFPQLELV